MKRSLAIAVSWLLLVVAGAHAQNRAELLTTGRITKIDIKKKIITVRTQNDAATAPARRTPPPEPRGGIGGGRRRRGGIGFPGGGPFPGPRDGGRRRAPTLDDQGKQFKVYVTDDTAINDTERRLSFLNLNVGDHITIQGLPKGKGDDIEASKITLSH